MKTFYIAKILNQDLMSRPLADDFYNYVKNSGEVKVIIDFSGGSPKFGNVDIFGW